jgi:hypothetical protein
VFVGLLVEPSLETASLTPVHVSRASPPLAHRVFLPFAPLEAFDDMTDNSEKIKKVRFDARRRQLKCPSANTGPSSPSKASSCAHSHRFWFPTLLRIRQRHNGHPSIVLEAQFATLRGCLLWPADASLERSSPGPVALPAGFSASWLFSSYYCGAWTAVRPSRGRETGLKASVSVCALSSPFTDSHIDVCFIRSRRRSKISRRRLRSSATA